MELVKKCDKSILEVTAFFHGFDFFWLVVDSIRESWKGSFKGCGVFSGCKDERRKTFFLVAPTYRITRSCLRNFGSWLTRTSIIIHVSYFSEKFSSKLVSRSIMHQNTPPETDSSHLKMDGWNTNFLLGRLGPFFRGRLAVSFRECKALPKNF